MITVNIHDAKTQLSRYIDQACTGEDIVIAKAGKPVAKLVAISQNQTSRALGLGKHRFTLPTDFDQMLAQEIGEMFEHGI